MAEYIEDCEVFATSSDAVAVSHWHRMKQKIKLKGRVDTETGEVTFDVAVDKIDILRA